MLTKSVGLIVLAAVAAIGSSAVSAIELTTNGDFEAGDFTGWSQFPTGAGQQSVTNVNPFAGTFAGEINNSTSTSNSLIKQANLGVGLVTPGQTISISFAARGSLTVGGVAFAEFFSERATGGVSKQQILGGGPLALNVNPNVWTQFSFTTTAGSDVSGGVTLQLGATNGATPSPNAHIWYDQVSVSIEVMRNGDYNADGRVDAADYTRYRDNLGTNTTLPNDTTPGSVTAEDYTVWVANYGAGASAAAATAIPEPTTALLLMLTAACCRRPGARVAPAVQR